MSIRVLFFASLRDITGLKETNVDGFRCSTMGDVFAEVARNHPLLEARRSALMFAVNSELARLDTPVNDGDEVAILPPVSGG